MLQLGKLAFAVDDVERLELMNRPTQETLTDALNSLKHLGALDDNNKLTHLGNIMVEFPLDPSMAKTLIASCNHHCSDEILTIAAMMSGEKIYFCNCIFASDRIDYRIC